MNSFINSSALSESYGYLWRKYRPAILKLMIASAEAPQEYKFSAHEVRAANPKDKSRFTFTLTIHKSKAVNDIRTSLIAKDLLRVLQESGKATELSEASIYDFKFDKHFVLHVVKRDIQTELPEGLPDVVTEQPVEG
jgi:hypothetical protein